MAPRIAQRKGYETGREGSLSYLRMMGKIFKHFADSYDTLLHPLAKGTGLPPLQSLPSLHPQAVLTIVQVEAG
jgi:hypothetical protein